MQRSTTIDIDINRNKQTKLFSSLHVARKAKIQKHIDNSLLTEEEKRKKYKWKSPMD